MGHMDDGTEEPTHTVKIFWPHAGMPEHYRGCTNLDTDVNELTFTDSAGKQHQVFGLPYEVLEE